MYLEHAQRVLFDSYQTETDHNGRRGFTMFGHIKEVRGVFPSINAARLKKLLKNKSYAKDKGHGIWEFTGDYQAVLQCMYSGNPEFASAFLVEEFLKNGNVTRKDPFAATTRDIIHDILRCCRSSSADSTSPSMFSFRMIHRGLIEDMPQAIRFLRIFHDGPCCEEDIEHSYVGGKASRCLENGDLHVDFHVCHSSGLTEPFLDSHATFSLQAKSGRDLLSCLSELFVLLHPEYQEVNIQNADWSFSDMNDFLRNIGNWGLRNCNRILATQQGFVIGEMRPPFYLKIPTVERFKIGNSSIVSSSELQDKRMRLHVASQVGNKRKPHLIGLFV